MSKRPINPYRLIMKKYAKKELICTQCFSAPVMDDMAQCKRCIDLCVDKRLRKKNGVKSKSVNNFQKGKK